MYVFVDTYNLRVFNEVLNLLQAIVQWYVLLFIDFYHLI